MVLTGLFSMVDISHLRSALGAGFQKDQERRSFLGSQIAKAMVEGIKEMIYLVIRFLLV
jgi:hypothetical protein